MKKFLNEFKAFAMRGNVVDLAVGVIIGGAFGKITTSLVNDIIMPAFSLLLGGISFSDWKWVLQEAVYDDTGAEVTAAISINYGSFLATVLDFLILAFAIFCMVKAINTLHERMSRKAEEPAAPAAPPEPSDEAKLLTEIRDLLRERRDG